VRLAYLCPEAVLDERGLDPRNKVAAIGFVIDVLELAASALRKVAAWRHLVMRTLDKSAIVANGIARHAERNVFAGGSDTIAAGSNSNDRIIHR